MDENDLKPADIGLHTAWRRAQDRADWRNFVTTATLQKWTATDDDDVESVKAESDGGFEQRVKQRRINRRLNRKSTQ